MEILGVYRGHFTRPNHAVSYPEAFVDGVGRLYGKVDHFYAEFMPSRQIDFHRYLCGGGSAGGGAGVVGLEAKSDVVGIKQGPG